MLTDVHFQLSWLSSSYNSDCTPKTRSLWPTLLVIVPKNHTKVGVNRHFQASWASQPMCCLLGRPKYLSADLRFTGILLSSFFRHIPSELAEWNSTKIGHMVESECNLKTHVRNLGCPLPIQIGGLKITFFGWLRNLMATLTACIFGTKHDVDNQVSVLITARGLLYRLKMPWTLVHKRLQSGLPFLPILCKFCILFYCQASQTEMNKWNSTKLCQMVDGKYR